MLKMPCCDCDWRMNEKGIQMMKQGVFARRTIHSPQTLSGLLALALLVSGGVQADDVQINITGEITIPPCVVNNGTPVNIDFGTIDATTVNGTTHSKTHAVPVTCTYYSTNVAKVKVTGNAMSTTLGTDNVLVTTGPNAGHLGVALYQGPAVDASKPLLLNGNGAGFDITDTGWTGNASSSQFIFTLVPYKEGVAQLLGGTFTATATLGITYL
ncbi:minor pilin subunit PapF [Buttiauxella sp. JUb87]|nr:minor pilin subunit PapF [Buttiauxella sp. JUb87]